MKRRQHRKSKTNLNITDCLYTLIPMHTITSWLILGCTRRKQEIQRETSDGGWQAVHSGKIEVFQMWQCWPIKTVLSWWPAWCWPFDIEREVELLFKGEENERGFVYKQVEWEEKQVLWWSFVT